MSQAKELWSLLDVDADDLRQAEVLVRWVNAYGAAGLRDQTSVTCSDDLLKIAFDLARRNNDPVGTWILIVLLALGPDESAAR